MYYANVGESKVRSCAEYAEAGNFVMAYQKQAGYVGLGEVTASSVPVSEFKVSDQPILSLKLQAADFGHNLDDLDLCEFVVGVEWKKTFPLNDATTFVGVFADQNVVCKLRDPATLRFLAQSFPLPPQ